MTIDGLTTQTYSNTKASHDIAAVTGDTMAYLDYGETDCNSIFEINNAGTTKEVFEATNMTSTGTGMNNCHGNAVRYSKKEDFYTYSTGRRSWPSSAAPARCNGSCRRSHRRQRRLGRRQHGHQLLDSSIILFGNNGTAGGNKSQAFEFGLDGKLIKAFKSGGGATNFGDVQRLSNGNTIITYSTLIADSGSGRERHGRARDQGQRLVRLRRIPREPLRPPARHRAVARAGSSAGDASTYRRL